MITNPLYNLGNFLPRDYIYASRNYGLPPAYGPIVLFIGSCLFFTALTFLSLYIMFRNIDSEIVRKIITLISLSLGILAAYSLPSVSLFILEFFQYFTFLAIVIIVFAIFRIALLPHKSVSHYSTKLDKMKLQEMTEAIMYLSKLDANSLKLLASEKSGKFSKISKIYNTLAGSPDFRKLAELAYLYKMELERAKSEAEARKIKEEYRQAVINAMNKLIEKGEFDRKKANLLFEFLNNIFDMDNQK